MGLENSWVVDFVDTDPAMNSVVLFIIDSWDWSDERGHLFALQSKLYTYFGYVASGQMYEEYPSAKGRALRIDLISRYRLPTAAVEILNSAKVVAHELAVSLNWNSHSAGTAA